MERKIFEVYDMLKDNPAYSENFRESYKECYKLERLEGYVFKGTWSGYSIKPENDDMNDIQIKCILISEYLLNMLL